MGKKGRGVSNPQQPESESASRTESWWKTLPGILTAVAGILTAVAGLLVVLNQIGLIGGKDAPIAQPLPPAASLSGSKPELATASANNGQFVVTFPSGTEVKFDGRGRGTYKLLNAEVTPRSTGKLTLKLSIRMSNNGPLDVGFWSDSFRLLVDGVPRAPVNFLNELVDARSAKEGDVEFEMPDSAGSLALQVLVGNKSETMDLPITLNKSSK